MFTRESRESTRILRRTVKSLIPVSVFVLMVTILIGMGFGVAWSLNGENSDVDVKGPVSSIEKKIFSDQFNSTGSYPASFSPRDDSYDVLHYDLTYSIDPDQEYVEGVNVVSSVARQDGFDQVLMHFHGMNIASISQAGSELEFARNGDELLLTLAEPQATNDEFTLTISFSGYPQSSGELGINFAFGVIYTFAEPEGARNWFPCKDVPSDKATFDFHFTVPSEFIIASNGLLTGTEENGSTTTYHWSEPHQMATYLAVLSAAEYAHFSDDYLGLPLEYYVDPSKQDDAEIAFAAVPEMIGIFDNLYGPYPFVKYGMAEVPFGGAMEHQDMTSMGSGVLFWDTVIVHELAHMWWGDLVTPSDWRDIWLNEGFATYGEALYKEALSGQTALTSYMRNMQNYYKDAAQYWEGFFPLYDPSYMWGATVYDKGGCVVHMLRYVLGDDVFFPALRNYGQEFAYGNATTAELEQSLEKFTGDDLTLFFQEWVYQAGYPSYVYSWYPLDYAPAEKKYRFIVHQTQSTDFPVFTIPLPIRITNGENSQELIISSTQQSEEFEILVDFPPAHVQFDPDRWLLCDNTVSESADFNIDGRSDGLDLIIFSRSQGLSATDPGYYNRADYSGDGTISNDDLATFAQTFGTVY